MRAGLGITVDVALPEVDGFEKTVVVTASAFATPEDSTFRRRAA